MIFKIHKISAHKWLNQAFCGLNIYFGYLRWLLLLDLNFKWRFTQFCLMQRNSTYNKALRSSTFCNQKSFLASFCTNKSQIRAKSAAFICRKIYHFFMLHHTKNRQFVKLLIFLVQFNKRVILHKSSMLYYYNVHNNLIM